jgi:hypothetical protein
MNNPTKLDALMLGIAISDSMRDLLERMHARWANDSTREAVADYAADIAKRLPPSCTFVRINTVTFGFTFRHGKHVVLVTSKIVRIVPPRTVNKGASQ